MLGVSAGRRSGPLALHAGLAIVGYMAGSWAGARIAGHPTPQQPVWPRAVTGALALELGLFVIFATWWEASAAHPSLGVTYALLAVNAMALGVQSSAVLRLGVPGLSTTYLTGTLTQVVASTTRPGIRVSTRSVFILLALLAGAATGAVLAIMAPAAAPALPLGAIAVVVVVSAAAVHRAR